MRYSVYVDRDVSIEVTNDRQAEAVAASVTKAIDDALAEYGVTRYARTTCHRGERSKMIFDREFISPGHDE